MLDILPATCFLLVVVVVLVFVVVFVVAMSRMQSLPSTVTRVPISCWMTSVASLPQMVPLLQRALGQ